MSMNESTMNLLDFDRIKSLDELSGEQIEFLKQCMYNHDVLVRFDTIELLGRLEQNETAIRLLRQLMWDKNEIIASEACEALRLIGNERCIDALKKRVNARSTIVRGCAIISIADLCVSFHYSIDDTKKFFKTRMKREKSAWVLSHYGCAMYLLGEKEYINLLLQGLCSKDYHVRAATVSLIKDFVLGDEQAMKSVGTYVSKHMNKTSREYEALIEVLRLD